MIKGIKRVLNNRIFGIVFEAAIYGMMFYVVNKAAITSIEQSSFALKVAMRDMLINFQAGLATPEGSKLAGFFGMEFLAFFVIPVWYISIWIGRLLRWMDGRESKRKQKPLNPTLATGD